MAHWDGNKMNITYVPDKPCEDYPGWVEEDCGCCAGLQWGGDMTDGSPRECSNCKGGGSIFHHLKSGVIAEFPGGPLLGRRNPNNEPDECGSKRHTDQELEKLAETVRRL